jgi:hypothetical protein
VLPPGRLRRPPCPPAVLAVTPTVVNGIKAVVVNEGLREIQPMAYNFVKEFAKDNKLQVVEACLIPDEKA